MYRESARQRMKELSDLDEQFVIRLGNVMQRRSKIESQLQKLQSVHSSPPAKCVCTRATGMCSDQTETGGCRRTRDSDFVSSCIGDLFDHVAEALVTTLVSHAVFGEEASLGSLLRLHRVNSHLHVLTTEMFGKCHDSLCRLPTPYRHEFYLASQLRVRCGYADIPFLLREPPEQLQYVLNRWRSVQKTNRSFFTEKTGSSMSYDQAVAILISIRSAHPGIALWQVFPCISVNACRNTGCNRLGTIFDDDDLEETPITPHPHVVAVAHYHGDPTRIVSSCEKLEWVCVDPAVTVGEH